MRDSDVFAASSGVEINLVTRWINRIMVLVLWSQWVTRNLKVSNEWPESNYVYLVLWS